jgi:hypothetical protein
MGVGAPPSGALSPCPTAFVKSVTLAHVDPPSVPDVVIVFACVLMVMVPDPLQFQFGAVLKSRFHVLGSTLTAGGMVTLVQQDPLVQLPPHTCPHNPQLLGSVCSLTQAPLHPV